MASRFLLLFVVAAVLWITAIGARLVAARPDAVWLLASLPLAAVLMGPRTWTVITLAVCELTALVPLHGLVTLWRAARLEGG